MKRIFLALAVIATLLGATGVAVAQEVPNATETTAAPEGVVEQDATVGLSPTTTVTHWRFESGTWELTIESTVPTRVTVSDSTAIAKALSDGDGAKSSTIRAGRQSFNVPNGETTIQFDGTVHQGMSAVTLTANNGGNVGVLRTDDWTPTKPAVAYGTTQALVGGATIVTAGSIYRWVKKRREEKKMEIDRVL